MSDGKQKDFKACVPLEDRPRNDVDRYLRNIEEIQGYCTHDFRFLKPPDFRESKVPGVFIIFQANWNPLTEPKNVELQCLECSKQKIWDRFRVCPKCLWEGGFEKSNFLHGRVIYFGESYSYYRARLYKCPKCDLRMVADEWDQ